VLGSSCGPNMNTWFVASHPIGHCVETPEEAKDTGLKDHLDGSDADLDKTFFMKARIFAGQAEVINSTYGLEEFKWLAKEEIEKHVTIEYWTSIKNMLVEQ